jgi:hypothetical protein
MAVTGDRQVNLNASWHGLLDGYRVDDEEDA